MGDGLMAATRAFDLALFAPQTPANVGDGPVVSSLGPPYATSFVPLAQASKPGVVVGNSVPAAVAQNQILISGPGPGFAWGLGTNPAAAATVPPATAQYQMIMADGTNLWQTTAISTVLALGGAVTNASGASFAAAANIVFQTAASITVRLDGGDPLLSKLDNFMVDAGTF